MAAERQDAHLVEQLGTARYVDFDLGIALADFLDEPRAAIAVTHTALGPDHYLPFVLLAQARGWSRTRAAWVTAVCGIGHVLSSLLLGTIGLALGVGVDFAIHLRHAYERARENGRGPDAALTESLQKSGRAIRWNATVLSLGFIVLTASALKPNHSLGVLLSAAMAACYAMTLLLLPSQVPGLVSARPSFFRMSCISGPREAWCKRAAVSRGPRQARIVPRGGAAFQTQTP